VHQEFLTMSEKQRLAFCGTVITKIGDARQEGYLHSESSVCFYGDIATVEPHDGGVTVSVATQGDPTVEVKILLDDETAKRLACAINDIAFADCISGR
jgi:hypothetical protein